MKIILASKSKSKKQLLTDLKIPFDVVVSNADETPNSSLPFGEQLKEITRIIPIRHCKIVAPPIISSIVNDPNTISSLFFTSISGKINSDDSILLSFSLENSFAIRLLSKSVAKLIL